MIGDIAYNPTIDTADFQLCKEENLAIQYYAFTKTFNKSTYLQEKSEVWKIFEENYKPIIVEQASGLLRIRFLVNCQGKAGRFRVIGMDKNYQEKVFPDAITQQLITITKNLLEWEVFDKQNQKRDYYQYLIFKIENGNIIDILP